MPRSTRPFLPALLTLLFALAPGFAAADVGQRLPKLTKLSEDVVRGGMPLGYVPLRQIWQEWDQGEPAQVEATLASLSKERMSSSFACLESMPLISSSFWIC